jgi:type I restriction enzyme, S subunit
MNLLEQHFDVAFAAPDGIKKLRELILTLAMQGKLVPQDHNDEPASELLRSIEIEKQRLVKEGKIKPPKSSVDHAEEIPYELPNRWTWVNLGDITFEAMTGIDKGKSFQSESNQYPYFKMNNISNFGYCDFSSITRINYEEEDYEKYLLKDGDFLFNTRNSRELVGKTCIFKSPNNERWFFNNNILRIDFPDLIDNYFINFWFLSPLGKSELEKLKSATTNVAAVYQGKLITFLVPIPPLAEQRRIVAKIDQLMARCDELEKLRVDRSQRLLTVHTAALDRLLTAKDSSEFSTAWSFITQHFGELYAVKENVVELRKTILQLAVMGKLVRQNPNDEPASELLRSIELEKQRLVKEGKIKSQKLLPEISPEEIPYILPKSWEWVRTDDLCIGITSGSTPPNNIFSDTEGIPFLKVYNIRNQKVDFRYKSQFITEEYHKKGKRSCLKPGDVLMNIVGPPLGKIAIVPDDFPEYNCNQAIVFFRPVVKSMNEYIYLYLLGGNFLDNIDLIGTAGQDNISVTKSRSILIPLPPLAEQGRIVEKIDRLMGMCDRLEESISSGKGKQTDLLNALMSKV